MNKIKDLPILDRPREKALRYGLDKLSNEELLALLIGFGGKDNSALDIAKTMLVDSHGLYYLAHKSIEELKEYKGISTAKALNLSAIFELFKRYQEKEYEMSEEMINAPFLYQKYISHLNEMPQETFILIVLDKRKQITYEITLYKGGNHKLSISYRNLFKQIIIHNGYYFYVIHNHPDGSLTPSKNDILFTSQLTRRCDNLDIVLLDHLIFTDRGYYSFLEDKIYEKETFLDMPNLIKIKK